MNRAILVLALPAVAALLAGCKSSSVDLSAVQNFAKEVSAASSTVDQIPTNYAQACDAMIEFNGETTLGMLGTPPPAPSNFTTQPVASLPPPPAVAPPPTPIPIPAGTASGAPILAPIPIATPTAGPSCQSVHDVASNWKTSNTTVDLYVKKLGELAGVTTAPSQSAYTSFADAVASDGLLSKPVAEATSSFIVAIGNRIISGEQERDIIDVVNASQQNGVLDAQLTAGENAAIDAHIQYLATLDAVNSRYNEVISPETLLLGALTTRARRTPDAQKLLGQAGLCSIEQAEAQANHHCVPPAQLESWYALEAKINKLRLEILHQRADWTQSDRQLLANDSQLQPYVNTLRDIGQVNASLVKHETGFAGLFDEIRPWLIDLASQASKLGEMSKAATGSTSTSH